MVILFSKILTPHYRHHRNHLHLFKEEGKRKQQQPADGRKRNKSVWSTPPYLRREEACPLILKAHREARGDTQRETGGVREEVTASCLSWRSAQLKRYVFCLGGSVRDSCPTLLLRHIIDNPWDRIREACLGWRTNNPHQNLQPLQSSPVQAGLISARSTRGCGRARSVRALGSLSCQVRLFSVPSSRCAQ